MKSRHEPEPITTHEQLERAFEGIPADPRTGYPPGFLGFAAELDRRIALRMERRVLALVNRPPATDFLQSLRERAQASLR